MTVSNSMVERYSLTGCPYCAKVERTLEELATPYTRHEVPSLRSRRSTVQEVSGQAGVPVLVDREHGVDGMAESDDLVEHPERTYR